jgi:hypothetical protein
MVKSGSRASPTFAAVLASAPAPWHGNPTEGTVYDGCEGSARRALEAYWDQTDIPTRDVRHPGRSGPNRGRAVRSVFDPGCVKTRNLAKSRESSSQIPRHCSSVCSSRTQSDAYEGILFSAICSALRFYTAKTRSGHSARLEILQSNRAILRLGRQPAGGVD